MTFELREARGLPNNQYNWIYIFLDDLTKLSLLYLLYPVGVDSDCRGLVECYIKVNVYVYAGEVERKKHPASYQRKIDFIRNNSAFLSSRNTQRFCCYSLGPLWPVAYGG